MRPLLATEFGYQEYFLDFNYFGRRFANIKETQAFFAAGKTYPLFKPLFLPIVARFGLSLLREATAIASKKEQSFDLGIVVGIASDITFKAPLDNLIVGVNWDSHIYPAGLDGGILLANARRQVIGLHVGVKLP